jgi:hypothetical protein
MIASRCSQHIDDEVAMIPSPSDDLHNVFWWTGLRLFQTRINITVQGILEKSQTTSATESTLLTAGLQAISTDAGVGALGKFERN